MDDSKKIKLLTATTVALILLNVAVVVFMWWSPPAGLPRPDRNGRDRAETIIRELQLNEEQQRKFSKLKDEHHNATREILERDRHTHDILFDLLRNGQDSSATADSLIHEIGENRKAIEYNMMRHLAQVRKLCNADQQKRFDAIIIELMARGGGEGPLREALPREGHEGRP